MGGFCDYFAGLADPRAGNARHDLLELMFVALAAVLCGAEDCTDMAQFAEAKLKLLREVVKLEHGPPSHDTFSRVFRLLRPEPFEAAFAKFTFAFAGALKGVVAIDGKALRGAYERGRKATPLHLVNVWAAEARLVIGQRLAPGRNEVLGAQQILGLLRLDGCIVTADALHCRADTAQAIMDAGADYVLALKANHPTLLAQAKTLIKQPIRSARPSPDQPRPTTVSKGVRHRRGGQGHGLPRFGRRRPRSRPGARSAKNPNRRSCASTCSPPRSPSERMLDGQDTLEHREPACWVLDVAFDEDRVRSRKDNAPQNLALIRKLALNIIRHTPQRDHQDQDQARRLGRPFLLSMLGHMR